MIQSIWDNMGMMICMAKGGLHSLSALSKNNILSNRLHPKYDLQSLLDLCMYCTVFFASDRVTYSSSCENIYIESRAKFSEGVQFGWSFMINILNLD